MAVAIASALVLSGVNAHTHRYERNKIIINIPNKVADLQSTIKQIECYTLLSR